MIKIPSILLAVMVVIVITPIPCFAKTSAHRSPRINDAYELEELSQAVFSHDGQALAFVRRRPANSQVTNALVIPEIRDDIWIQEAAGRPANNLTNGAADSSGWWDPKWSPDGQRLAMLSSRGGNVTPWVWERETGGLRQVSQQGIEFEMADGGCHWLDRTRLLCMAMRAGERSTPTGSGGNISTSFGKIAERVIAAWAKAARGEATASAIDSLTFAPEQRRLISIDVEASDENTAAILEGMRDASRSWWLSPAEEDRAIAYVLPLPSSFPRHDSQLIGVPRSLELRFLDGRAVSLNKLLPDNVVTQSLRWSPDGGELAFFALGEALIHPELIYGRSAPEVQYPAVASKEYSGKLWRVNIKSGRVEQWDTADIDLGTEALPPPFEWTGSGELLFRAPRLMKGARPVVSAPQEWRVLERSGRTRPLLKEVRPLPDALQAIDNGRAFIGLVEGDLWRIDSVTGTARNLTGSFAPQVVKFHSHLRGARGQSYLILQTSDPKSGVNRMRLRVGFPVLELSSEYAFNTATEETTPLVRPVPHAKFTDFNPNTMSSIYVVNDQEGSFLWRGEAGGQAEQLVAINVFLKSIVKHETRYVEYVSNNGEKLRALLHLPVGYQPGRSYPLVVECDLGSYSLVGGETSNFDLLKPESFDPPVATHSANSASNGVFFSAAGYAYMFASWPSTSMDDVGRANLLLGTNGVNPAVDEVIRQGVADPDRLFLYGHSTGGWSAFALATQTNRFKATIAASGWVDQIATGLSLGYAYRYSDNPFDSMTVGQYLKTRIALPFWRNADLLRRNSPLSYVDRVQTPMMIIASDLDGMMPQSEMFFSALVQQRKPAEFIRYWGEGHDNRTPANGRDQWQRMLAWFDKWGDISRDANGDAVWDGDHVKSRKGTPALKPEDYAKFPLFGPGGVK